MADRRQHAPSVDGIAFNEWHRTDSLMRFLAGADARRQAYSMSAIDLDLLEYDNRTGKTVLLHEIARDIGQNQKQVRVLRELARQLNPQQLDDGAHALLTLYRLSDEPNPAAPDTPDIAGFRARLIWPVEDREFTAYTPREYAVMLYGTVTKLKQQVEDLKDRSA